MTLYRTALLGAVAALTLCVGHAGALDANALTCFGRIYDFAYLAKHPDQLITKVKLCFKRRDDGRAPDFTLDIAQRGATKTLHTLGYCRSGKEGLNRGVSCNIECDGGGIYVEFASATGRYVLMYLDDRGIRMQECGKEELDDGTGTTVTAGKDDHVFRLDRMR
jgi:hypothetical protein